MIQVFKHCVKEVLIYNLVICHQNLKNTNSKEEIAAGAHVSDSSSLIVTVRGTIGGLTV